MTTTPSTTVRLRIEVEVERARWPAGSRADQEIAEGLVDLVERGILLAPRVRAAPAALSLRLAERPSAPTSPGHARVTIRVSVSIAESRWRAVTEPGATQVPLGEDVRSYVASVLSAISQLSDAGAATTVIAEAS